MMAEVEKLRCGEMFVVRVGDTIITHDADEMVADSIQYSVNVALAQARLAAIDECLCSAYHWRDFVGPGPWQEHIEKLQALKEST